MPPAKKKAPAKPAPQPTVTLKHLAAALAEDHDLPKRQAEAILGDLVTLTTRHLKKGDKIRLNGIGILQVRKRAARMVGTQRPVRRSTVVLRVAITTTGHITESAQRPATRSGAASRKGAAPFCDSAIG